MKLKPACGLRRAVVLACALLCANAYAVEHGAATPAEIAQRLHAVTGVPGVAVASVTETDIEVGVAGVRRGDRSDAVLATDLFHAGSVTKSVTALVAGILVERGAIAWTTTLADAFPELVPSMQPAYRAVTLQDLLAHQGGVVPLPDQASLGAVPPLPQDPAAARRAFLLWALSRPPASRPGVDTAYSNGGYAVAAAMLERAAATNYETLADALVFAPLHVPTTFGWPGAHGAAAPWGHVEVGGGWVPNDPDAPENRFPPFLDPSGNASLDAAALGRVLQAHLRGLDGECVLAQPQTYTQLHTPRSTAGNSLGWLEADGISYADGSAGTFYVVVALVPAAHKAAVVAVNGASDRPEFLTELQRAAGDLIAYDPPADHLFHAGFERCAP